MSKGLVILIVMCSAGGLFVLLQVRAMLREARGMRGGAMPRRRDIIDADSIEVPDGAGHDAAPPWVASALQLVNAARSKDSAAIAKLVAESPDAVEPSMIALIIDKELDLAETIGAAAEQSVAVLHQRAVVAAMRGDRAAALPHLRAALAKSPDHVPTLVELTGALRGTPESIEHADRALALAPDDAIAKHNVIVARLQTGDFDGARAKLATAALPEQEKLVLEKTLEQFVAGNPPAFADTYPTHAALAAERGRALIEDKQWDAAIHSLQRAHELHPTNLEIAGDFGFALSSGGRDREALEHYDRAIPNIAAGDLLRINRGNARRRLGDIDGAVADYQFLVERLPDILEPRIALVAVLADAKRMDEARSHLDTLKAKGAPDDILEALATVVDRA